MKNHHSRVRVIFLMVMLFLLFFVGAPLYWLYQKDTSFQMMCPAISISKAKKMVKDEECYIVRCKKYADNATSLFYYEEKGEKKQIYLTGNSPYYELSTIFFEPNQNRFLLKGHLDDNLTDFYGETFFYVDTWYLIIPVKRAYVTRTDNMDAPRPDRRFFFPNDGLDQYDIEQGDYIPLKQNGDIFMRTIEMQYYEKQDGYYLIMPQNEKGTLKWYLVQRDDTQSELDIMQALTLEGNIPQHMLHHTILDNTLELQSNNYFLVKGDMSEKENGDKHLLIYKWWLHQPFHANNVYPVFGESKWGFTQEDIKNKIYHSFR